MFRDKIKSEILSQLADYFRIKPGVQLVFLFGSAASGKMTDESDIDIGILFESEPDIFEINELKSELNGILKREIDIAVLNSAAPVLKMQVLKKGIPVFTKEKKYYNQFFVDTINQYDDLKQTRKICEDNILKGRIYAG
ncbi:MAG TPA: nucleotidyltransferase domain-containing protein [Smithellaceae bacterium]|jgi:predicted nucleotidyltransferase|nr:nucleotidyltransferase domain-containing protein [Smithellaceae bacterium]